MKLFIGSLVIFFGTLLAAGLLALGQPDAMDMVPHVTSSGRPGASASDQPGRGDRGDESVWERLLAIRGFH